MLVGIGCEELHDQTCDHKSHNEARNDGPGMVKIDAQNSGPDHIQDDHGYSRNYQSTDNAYDRGHQNPLVEVPGIRRGKVLTDQLLISFYERAIEEILPVFRHRFRFKAFGRGGGFDPANVHSTELGSLAPLESGLEV